MTATSLRLSRRAERAGGQPIGELMHQALAKPELISLAAGFVDQASLPVEETMAAFQSLWKDAFEARAALQYGSTAGSPHFRQQLLARLSASDSGVAGFVQRSLDQVVVTAGSNQLLYLLTDTLCEPDDIILCAAPTYFVFLGMLQQLGVRAQGVAADGGGLVPDSLDGALAQLAAEGLLAKVKALYLCSYFDNPTGISLAPERRVAVLETLRKWSTQGRIHLIEDIAYRQLRFAGDDWPTVWAHDTSGETVILADTFSKCFAPGLRLGYAVLPRDLVGPIHDQKSNIDFGAPNLAQHLVSRVLDAGLLEPHVEQLREAYRAKRDAMLDACHRYLGSLPGVEWVHPAGGLYVWLTLPESMDTSLRGRLFPAALAAGVLYVPGGCCFPPTTAGPAGNHTIRLSYGVQSPERIALGIEKLAQAVRQVGSG